MFTETVIPSRMILQNIVNRKKSAEQGHNLLKTKADAMKLRFRTLMKEILTLKKKTSEELNQAAYVMAKANYSVELSNNWQQNLIQSVKNPPALLNLSIQNIAGVKLMKFDLLINNDDQFFEKKHTVRGQQVLKSTKDVYMIALVSLVELASAQSAFSNLKKQLKVTNRKVNALSNFVIPYLEEKIDYVVRELEELDREEFFRLKKIQVKKNNNNENLENYSENLEKDENDSIFYQKKDLDIIF